MLRRVTARGASMLSEVERARRTYLSFAFGPSEGVVLNFSEVLPELVLGERRRIALEMLGELAEIADTLFFRGQSIIFEIDVLLELSDRRIVKFHRREGALE